MFHWKTEEIVAALSALPGVSVVNTEAPGGDYDTTQIIVHVKDTDGRIFVSGFPSTNKICKTPNDAECQWVEIGDGDSSRGGLNSSNALVAQVYTAVRQHFVDRDAEVINHFNEIF